MGLFRRSTGKLTRAEKKAARKIAEQAEQQAAELKLTRVEAKAAAKAAKADAKTAKKLAKIDAKAEKADAKVVRKAAKKSGTRAAADLAVLGSAGKVAVSDTAREPMTAKRARRLIGVGQVVLPVLAPYALAAAGTVRGAWDTRRAERLGVTTDQLSSFAGPGGALHARLSHVADALTKLETSSDGRAGTPAHAFVESTRPRIADLSVAVRAAEQMPASRRRAAFRAIGNELDTIESTLLGHLGITT